MVTLSGIVYSRTPRRDYEARLTVAPSGIDHEKVMTAILAGMEEIHSEDGMHTVYVVLGQYYVAGKVGYIDGLDPGNEKLDRYATLDTRKNLCFAGVCIKDPDRLRGLQPSDSLLAQVYDDLMYDLWDAPATHGNTYDTSFLDIPEDELEKISPDIAKMLRRNSVLVLSPENEIVYSEHKQFGCPECLKRFLDRLTGTQDASGGRE